MATTNTEREAIFSRLDELFGGNSASTAFGNDDFRDSSSSSSSTDNLREAKSIAGNVSDKEYAKLRAYSNCTSYSKLQDLHDCPRFYELNELRASATLGQKRLLDEDDGGQSNVHFAYGHAVGAGIQTYAATGDLQAAQFAAFISWKAPYDAEATDAKGNPKGDKSLAWAMYAVEKFAIFWREQLSDWEILQLPGYRNYNQSADTVTGDDGKPAVEVAFSVNTQNGYFHFGHIDAILKHKTENRLAVWEGKTTNKTNVPDAAYANSYQALGYSVVVDAIAKHLELPLSDYEVFYIVYSSSTKEFLLLPFTKNLAQRAEWLQDLLLDHAMISKYRELQFFPKRGEQCVNKYGRTCEWFGNCGLKNSSLFPKAELQVLESAAGLKAVDFHFTLDQLVDAQKGRAEG